MEMMERGLEDEDPLTPFPHALFTVAFSARYRACLLLVLRSRKIDLWLCVFGLCRCDTGIEGGWTGKINLRGQREGFYNDSGASLADERLHPFVQPCSLTGSQGQ